MLTPSPKNIFFNFSNSLVVCFSTIYSNDTVKGDRADFRDDWKVTIEELKELFK
jgi:hypothetical protein